MPSEGQYQKPAGVLKPCGCDHSCSCHEKKNIPGVANELPYKGNPVLNAQKS